jgi:hypothetical protein
VHLRLAEEKPLFLDGLWSHHAEICAADSEWERARIYANFPQSSVLEIDGRHPTEQTVRHGDLNLAGTTQKPGIQQANRRVAAGSKALPRQLKHRHIDCPKAEVRTDGKTGSFLRILFAGKILKSILASHESAVFMAKTEVYTSCR